jgi:hypothetical protein
MRNQSGAGEIARGDIADKKPGRGNDAELAAAW